MAQRRRKTRYAGRTRSTAYTDLSSVKQCLYARFTATSSPTAASGQGSHATVHLSTTSPPALAPAPPPAGDRRTSNTSGSPGASGSRRSAASGGGGGSCSGRWNHLSLRRNDAADGAAAAASGRGVRTARTAWSTLRWNCSTISSAPLRPPPAESDIPDIAGNAEPEPPERRPAPPPRSSSCPSCCRAAWLALAAVRLHKSDPLAIETGGLGGCLDRTDRWIRRR